MLVCAENDQPKNYFDIQKRALHLLGLPLAPNLNIFYKAYSYVILILMILYAFLMLPDLFTRQENFDDLINNWLFDTGYTVALVKVFTLLLNRSKLNRILSTLETDIFAPDIKRGGKIEYIWINNCVALTRKLSIISISVGFATIISCITASYAVQNSKGNRKFPFGSLSFLAEHFSYETTFFYHTAVYGMIIQAFMLVDVIYSSVLAHICVQCKILQNSIKGIINRSGKNTTKGETFEMSLSVRQKWTNIPYKYLQKKLKAIVLHHMAILKVAEEIEDVFNIPTLAVFTGMSVCFCFIMYHGSLYSFLDPNFLKDFLIMITAMLPLVINSYWGSEVIFESRAVADACYEVDFVGTDVKFQKALVLIMQRSQKPIKLTVGKFATLSLVTMLGVLRMSYSYFMLLRKMNEH